MRISDWSSDVCSSDLEKVFRLNVHANQRLLRAVHPLLHASPSGRAIFVTSSVGARPRAYWGAYAASKAALDAMVRTYAQEVAQSNTRELGRASWRGRGRQDG